MDDFHFSLSDKEIEDAKKRIWLSMEAKLPSRGLSQFQTVVSAFRISNKYMPASRLAQMQSKERIMDMLPDRPGKKKFAFVVTRRAWATATLSVFMAFLFVPVLQFSEVASAASYNTLEVVQGDVLVNGAPITGEMLLQEGDRVYTGPGSMAHITFLDDSRATLGPSTNVELAFVQSAPGHKTETHVVLHQDSGRVWVQTLNLMSDSYFVLEFDEGQVLAEQRASFDVQLDEGVEVQVARNLVDVILNGEVSYEGIVGQGAFLTFGEQLLTSELSPEMQDDVWWEFNLAYGKIHTRNIDERYKDESVKKAIILPGNPLYVFKTFRESALEVLTFSTEAKQKLVAKHAENRLNEAQALIEQGDVEGATEVLGVYKETVEGKLAGSDNADLLAHLNEVKKGVLAKDEMDEGTELLDEHVTETAAVISSNLGEKSGAKLLSASQKLQIVPDLLEAGNFDKAMDYLSTYKAESLSILAQLEDVELEEREVVIEELLQKKLKDLQQLRVISSMLELEEALDVDAQVYEEMSLMALSLRERALDRLSNFFVETDYDAIVQQEVYERVKESSEMAEGLEEQFDAVEAGLADVAEKEGAVIEVEVVEELVDPRFEFTN
jgi:hypothetical protein